MIRELLGRTLVTMVVAAVYAAPLVLAGLGGPIDFVLPHAAVLEPLDGEPEAEEADWLSIPDGFLADAVPDEVAQDGAPVEVEPVLPPEPDAKVQDRSAGGAGGSAVVAGEGENAGENAGKGEHVARGEGDGEGARVRRGTKARGRKSKCADDHPHVRVADDGTVEIDRTLVEEYTRNLDAFMKLGYSHPYDEADVHGWYISGFSCTSPVSKAGFKRGDVLLSVNGKKTRSWVGVFMVYQKLKNKDQFEVELVRRGEPLTIRFRINENA